MDVGVHHSVWSMCARAGFVGSSRMNTILPCYPDDSINVHIIETVTAKCQKVWIPVAQCPYPGIRKHVHDVKGEEMQLGTLRTCK